MKKTVTYTHTYKTPSPGSLSARIRRYRELRGLTQRELGLQCGFPDSSADVRIGQYERTLKIPRPDAIATIAHALNITPDVLIPSDMADIRQFVHCLMDADTYQGLYPVQIGEEYYLKFEGDEFQSVLKEWAEERERCAVSSLDPDYVIKKKEDEYATWQMEYPGKIDVISIERKRNVNKLKAQLDAIERGE